MYRCRYLIPFSQQLTQSIYKQSCTSSTLTNALPQIISPIQASSQSRSPHHNIHTTPYRGGVMDTLHNAYDNAFSGNEAKREAAVFETQMKYLRSDKPIEGETFVSLLLDMRAASGLAGVKEHLPWVQNNPAMEQFKQQEKIAKTLADNGTITDAGIGAKKRAAAAAGVDLYEVDSVVSQAFQLQALQKWIRDRETDGLPIPKNSQELQRMISAPNSGIKGMRRPRRMPSPGVRQPKKKKRGY